MGLFVRDDDYDESVRMTGFNRYKQLLSFYSGHWFILGLISFVSAIPLIIAIAYSILSSSLLLLLIFCPIGGAILGPFFAGLVDSIMRGLRDDTGMRWDNYKKALKQNFPASIFPGAFLGLIIGIFCFVVYLTSSTAFITPTRGFYIIALISLTILLTFENLFWPQFVLFNQSFKQTLINIILFTSKYLWKVLFIAFWELVYIGIITVFAPFSIAILPFIGIWYPVFLVSFSLYEKLDYELQIEEKIALHQDL